MGINIFERTIMEREQRAERSNWMAQIETLAVGEEMDVEAGPFEGLSAHLSAYIRGHMMRRLPERRYTAKKNVNGTFTVRRLVDIPTDAKPIAGRKRAPAVDLFA